MNTENQIRVLKWTTFPLWSIVAAHLFWDVSINLIGAMLVGSARDVEESIWTFVRVALLIVIPIAYYFIIRRIQWNLPPEEHAIDRMNIKNQ